MFYFTKKYWIIRRHFTGVNLIYCRYPSPFSYDTILEGPIKTKEKAMEAFNYWSSRKTTFGGE